MCPGSHSCGWQRSSCFSPQLSCEEPAPYPTAATHRELQLHSTPPGSGCPRGQQRDTPRPRSRVHWLENPSFTTLALEYSFHRKEGWTSQQHPGNDSSS